MIFFLIKKKKTCNRALKQEAADSTLKKDNLIYNPPGHPEGHSTGRVFMLSASANFVSSILNQSNIEKPTVESHG